MQLMLYTLLLGEMISAQRLAIKNYFRVRVTAALDNLLLIVEARLR